MQAARQISPGFYKAKKHLPIAVSLCRGMFQAAVRAETICLELNAAGEEDRAKLPICLGQMGF